MMMSLQSAVCSTSDMRLFQHVVQLPLEARPGYEDKRWPSRPSTEMHSRTTPDRLNLGGQGITQGFASGVAPAIVLFVCLSIEKQRNGGQFVLAVRTTVP
jgi:hypothetical protein